MFFYTTLLSINVSNLATVGLKRKEIKDTKQFVKSLTLQNKKFNKLTHFSLTNLNAPRLIFLWCVLFLTGRNSFPIQINLFQGLKRVLLIISLEYVNRFVYG